MSKLYKLLQANQQARVAEDSGLSYANINEDFMSLGPNGSYGVIYSIGCVLKSQVAFSSYINIESAINDAKRMINEQVFGEFRTPLYELREQIYLRNYDKALDLLYELEQQMFTSK